MVGDFLVGEAVADAAIEFVQRFPLQFVVTFGGCGEEARGLIGTFESGGPDDEFTVVADGIGYQFRKFLSVKLTTLGDVGIAAYLTGEIVFRFAVLLL